MIKIIDTYEQIGSVFENKVFNYGEKEIDNDFRRICKKQK